MPFDSSVHFHGIEYVLLIGLLGGYMKADALVGKLVRLGPTVFLEFRKSQSCPVVVSPTAGRRPNSVHTGMFHPQAHF